MNTFFRQIIKGDRWIWAIYLLLIICSCIITYSAMSRLVLAGSEVTVPILRHMFFILAGVVIVITIIIAPIKLTRLLSYLMLLGAAVLLLYVAVAGQESGAAKRFSQVGQPSEFVKLFLIMTMADIVTRIHACRKFPTAVFVIVCAVMLGLLFLIFTENLSSAAIIFAVMVAMMLVGGIPFRKVAVLVVVVGLFAGSVIGLAFVVPQETFEQIDNSFVRRFDRMYTWKARFERSGNDMAASRAGEYFIDDDNFQTAYAKIALCRGGWAPHGPGSSLQRNYLPEAYSDFVFSIACEEWGFVMGVVLMLAYLLLMWRALHYVRRSDKVYRSVLIFGAAFVIVLQAGIHIAVSIGAIPVTGQTLPLISRGGTSILVVSALFGLMLKASADQYADRPEPMKALPEADETQKTSASSSAKDDDGDQAITIN